MFDDNETVKRIKEYIDSNISSFRVSHIYGVAETAAEMCLKFDPAITEKGYIAGLLHDITKEFEYNKHIELAKKYNLDLSDEDFKSPKILHSFTGAAYARELFPDVVDDDIYKAIYNHTTGCENMSLLEMIIFLSDYIEPERRYEECIRLRDYYYRNIDNENVIERSILIGLNDTIDYLLKNGQIINQRTIKARNYLINKLAKQGGEQ